MTQIGLMFEGQDGLNWPRWSALLAAAEDLGFQCVFRSDHFTNASGPHKDSLELWTSLTYAASHTRHIEFGPLVTPVTFRHPSMTARYAAAVHDLSEGRLVLGYGAGWQEREHTAFGVPFHDFPTRYAMLSEALELTQRLFTTPPDQDVAFDGAHFHLEGARLMPRRGHGPAILIGGNGPKRTLPLAAQYATEWNAVFLDRATYRERAALLDQLLAERGRTPGDVKRSLMTQVVHGRDEAALRARLDGRDADDLRARGLIVGTGAQVVDEIGAWAEAGVQRFMLQWLDLDDLEGIAALAQDALPHFHATA